MPKQLFHHLNKFISVSEDEFYNMLPYFEQVCLKKKEILVSAGSLCTHHHFVLEGCLHLYFITDKGVERTVQFAIENWWMTDNLAFHNQTITDFSIQAVEPTKLLSISYEKQEQLLQEFPQLEKYLRSIYQISYGASLVKMRYLLDFSKEEMYFHFTEQFPEFAQRVPQYLIASFLGLTPEYVSEIRAKKRS
ncbi:Crp/Fnr family transcriptional regulator [Flagellimonas hymeniacidonis]|uniref:Crp/Fnr family transcriptional regulator n=1 Tax=Flagellimonas hymeniacidonis TaxID=2603628 RepID=A0A5C8V338_9FLAO|nr:Crp/Fnr family transcriptional regulator [Flagellimonas hymeniacidonis]TXN35365.1 Crp/Fnr family transcriptional regulator [Flagellimonas hymeniacidonis]